MSTFQQIAGALGTAIAVSSIIGMQNYMSSDGANEPLALIAGVQGSFLFSMVIVAIGFVLSFFIKSSSPCK
ncbi:hypothetical protein QW71_03120 [Paenibacillus sp. IHB B 3415]|uniref:hypothetical protein n=1 Tax=Paenibacillus sp. IHB B 3415 TaxID=867080 RepID=UPI00057460DC|nr:hypothetical protein [Paenibacillus sp. IHB B 3415]KHL97159.1 hypothetical protein QW71_03120 [Paenibacillus sp. IHB B 3415]